MRALQVIWDGGGNTAPQLAIARELVNRGHDVRILAHDCQREKVTRTGAQFVPYRSAPQSDASDPATDLLRDWEARTPLGGFARVRDRLMYGPCGLFARDVTETLESEPADVVAWDYLLLGGGLAAEKARVPSAAVIHQIYPLPVEGVPPFGPGLQPARGRLGRLRDAVIRRALLRAFAPGLGDLNKARREIGLSPLDDPFGQFTAAERLLVLTSPAFDFAGSAPLPANVRYTGPVIEPSPTSGWESPWPADDDRPLVLASFSTTFMDQRSLVQRSVEALGSLPVRGLVTTGPAIDPAQVASPDNVRLEAFVPHSAVLPHASLVITHAGMGTVHAALAAGVPLLCMPGGRDQDDVAARVVFHGVGLRLRQGAGARKLALSVERALGDDSLRRNARSFSRNLTGTDGTARAADELEQLMGG